MKKFKKVGMLLLFILPAVFGFAGYVISDNSVWDSAYFAVRMYLFDADTVNNNFLVEVARWIAPVCTVSSILLMMKTALSKVLDFFLEFSSDAVALYGDTELKAIVKRNIKHAINVDDENVIDAKSHIIMFSSDEKSLEFFKKNKEKLRGEVFIMLEKNDSFSVSLFNVRFFNPCEIVARRFWQEHDIRRVIQKDELKISIVGDDVLSRKILTYGLLNNIYSLTQKIEYHIWSNDDFFEKSHSDFLTMNEDKIIYHDNNYSDRLFEIASSDRIIITEKIDNELIAEIAKMTNGEIYCFDSAGIFVNIFGCDNIFTFGCYEHVLTSDNIRTDNLYSAAKALNHHYATTVEGKTNDITPEEAWDELDSFTKGSNIASTDYHSIRLIVMHETGKNQADTSLSEMEHIRWCRYHFLNHWKYAETADGKRDVANKIHPLLKPFSELGEEHQHKDSDAVSTLISLGEN